MVAEQHISCTSVSMNSKRTHLYSNNTTDIADSSSQIAANTPPKQPYHLVPRILVVDTDHDFVQQFTNIATGMGYEVTISETTTDAAARLSKHDAFDLLVIDPQTSSSNEIDLVKHITECHPDLPLMTVTHAADIHNAVTMLKLGAVEYLIKPIRAATLRESLQAIFTKTLPYMELRHLRCLLNDRYDFSGMLSKTPAMHTIFERIRLVAATNVTVLLEGETGTGKELVATAIHMQSARKHQPLISLNCAGVPDSLLESELFGYERGAFTGAAQPRPGKIELADQGTLFLDEIESMSLAMQAKLLLVLQNRKIQRLGSSRTRHVDMRVIAATNVPLQQLVASGAMRSDFYFRINVLPLQIPSLRERRADIPLLVQDYIARHPVAIQRRIRGVSPQVLTELVQYPWPGNVRELQNVLERAIVLTQGPLVENLWLTRSPSYVESPQRPEQLTLPLRQWLNTQEQHYLCQQLDLAGGDLHVAAAHSGIDPRTFFRKLRRYGISTRSFRAKKAMISEQVK